MPDTASINRSINTVRNEIEFLRDSGALLPPQYQSILAQLPHDGKTSEYSDARFIDGGHVVDAGAISQAAQDPNHPANPDHPKHHEWVKKIGDKSGNAMVFGAGATMGSDLVHSAGL